MCFDKQLKQPFNLGKFKSKQMFKLFNRSLTFIKTNMNYSRDLGIEKEYFPNSMKLNLRSSRTEVFYEKGVLANFAIFTRKHLC